MLDTISLRLPGVEGPALNDLLARLDAKSIRPFPLSSQVTRHTGKLGHVHISITPLQVYISFSVPKCAYGYNIIRPTRADYERSIEGISDALGLDLGGGKITRIDLADTWPVAHPVPSYLHLFDTPKDFARQHYTDPKGGETLYLTRLTDKEKFEVLLYDKLAEILAHRGTLPPDYPNHPYLLRPEVRMTKGVQPQLKQLSPGLPYPLTAAHLTDPMIYRCLVVVWEDALLSIPTHNKPRLIVPNLATPSEQKDQLAAIGLQLVGSGAVEHMIASNRDLDKYRRRAMRRGYRELAALPVLAEPNELLDEFKRCVEQTKLAALSEC